MRTTTDYKNAALDALEGKWGQAALFSFIIIVGLMVPMYAVQFLFVGIGQTPEYAMLGQIFGNLTTFVMLPLVWAYTVVFLRMFRGQTVRVDSLWDGFRQYLRIFTTKFLQGIYTLLWSLLLIVPGVMKGYSYAMTDYILEDCPDLSDDRAINKSVEMMKGHRMDLFLLDLSFIGWALLALLTCGLGFILLYPYIHTARAAFYEDLKKEQQTLPKE